MDPTRLQNNLHTESGPAPVQSEEVASVLINIKQDLEDYESEIRRLGREMERLKHYATQLRSLIPPFSKLSDKILQDIFDDCCDMNTFRVNGRPKPMHLSQALKSKPAMVISSVCSRWRRIALSMPIIWSRISLNWGFWEDHEYTEDEMETRFFPLYNFLARSQQHLLTVHFEIRLFVKGELHPLLKQIFGQVGRWQCVSFTCHTGFTLSYIMGRCGIRGASFPALRELYTRGVVEPEDLTSMIDAAPKLQTLNLPNTAIQLDGLNHPQLSHLDFDPSLCTMEKLFDKCPNLFSLCIGESTWTGSGVDPMTIACSSKLEILTVRHGQRYDPPRFPYSVFRFLQLPSLKTLYLKEEKTWGDIDDPWSHLEHFMVFIQTSAFQLTTLTIQHLFISDANLTYILVHIPTLQNLTVDDSGITPKCSPISSELIESLHSYRTSSLRQQTAPILPRLRSLRLLNVAASTFRDLLVVDMIQSRWNPGKLCTEGTSAFEVDCLRAFTMTFLNRLETEVGDVYSPLGPIEKSGMMIVIQMSGVTLRD
ncbi:hypothetical protein BDP27DRAFT_1404936 [Rhodocollybia butyracea]|uniref:F-box domain-containing protein n=1 Tax=Rhodocollybia butyracea TaxID=206335 RepID=A0A9P5PNM6_9AGAR|nr:hypothetical protein BDP27DRAFT_1404936 [Rhodocollybia butyracea]